MSNFRKMRKFLISRRKTVYQKQDNGTLMEMMQLEKLSNKRIISSNRRGMAGKCSIFFRNADLSKANFVFFEILHF